MRDRIGPAVEFMMVFRPCLPTYKRTYFDVLEAKWRDLAPGDLIMLFNHCVDIMHLRLSRGLGPDEKLPWSSELLTTLDQRRQAPGMAPAVGDYLCGGVAASPGSCSVRPPGAIGSMVVRRPAEIIPSQLDSLSAHFTYERQGSTTRGSPSRRSAIPFG